MNEQLFQLVLIGVNALGVLFFYAMRKDVAHVRELLEIRIADQERRLERVEAKCSDCPSSS